MKTRCSGLGNQKKPEEELFDTFNDPHELRNLAKEPNFEKQNLIELRIGFLPM